MKFLVIDDAPDIVETVNLCLQMKYPDSMFLSACNGIKGLDLARKGETDLIILDIGLPDLDGFEICRQIRSTSHVPIIMLTGRDRNVDIVRGLSVGADDYITKPFGHTEFLARVQAVLRRSKSNDGNSEGTSTAGDLVVNHDTGEVWARGEKVRLTATEFRLLSQLVHNAGRMLTHQELLTKVWGQELTAKTEYLKVHVQHLRQKLGDSASSPKLMLTEHGMGYRFIMPVQKVKST